MGSLTPAGVRALLDAHGVRPSRALGQHFLADPNTALRIVRLAGVGPGDRVLEIGPGIGSLTLALADAGAEVLALERDRHLIPVLGDVLGGRANVAVLEGDAMTFDYASVLGGEAGRWSMVANLPYNIATPLLAHLLDDVPSIGRMLVMVQREVGERLATPPGTRRSGAVSVKVAYHAEASIAGTVAPTVFQPRPRVDSALVRIVRRPAPPVEVPSVPALFALVRAGFAQRRKTLGRALRGACGTRVLEVLERAQIDPRRRAEALTLDEWAALARAASNIPSP